MSAFLCSNDTISALVTYWSAAAEAEPFFEPQTGHAVSLRYAAYGIVDPARREDALLDLGRRLAEKDTEQVCFDLLLQGNIDSLRYRYSDADRMWSWEAYSYKRLPVVLSWLNNNQDGYLVGILRGYDYQSCEPNNWHDSFPYRITQQIANQLLKRLMLTQPNTYWADFDASKPCSNEQLSAAMADILSNG